MQVTIATLGSRGDVQPMLALGVALRRAGHAVRVATCDPFRELVESHGVEFASIGGDIREIAGDAGRRALVESSGKLIGTFRAIRLAIAPLVRQSLERMPSALEGSDVVMGQLLALGAEHWAAHRRVPFFEIAYLPTAPTRAFAHPAAPPTTPPGLASLTTWLFADQMIWQAFRPEIQAFRARLGARPAPLLGRVRRSHPVLMGTSAHVIPRPDDWPETAIATGFWTLDEPSGWSPPPALSAFLERGPAPVYVGFGSMTAEDPRALTEIVKTAARRASIRFLLHPGADGLVGVEGDDVLTIGDVPHAWLFPRTAGVVHHGGAGTTAAAFRAGVPQIVVPFLADQPWWGDRVARSGAGPQPIPIARLDAEGLEKALRALSSPAIRDRARTLGELVRSEPGADGIVPFVERHLATHPRGRA